MATGTYLKLGGQMREIPIPQAAPAPTRIVTQQGHAEVLRAAWKQVAPEPDWKDPINCMVPTIQRHVYGAAIEFMTGTTPVYELQGDMTRITAIGYRAGPCN